MQCLIKTLIMLTLNIASLYSLVLFLWHSMELKLLWSSFNFIYLLSPCIVYFGSLFDPHFYYSHLSISFLLYVVLWHFIYVLLVMLLLLTLFTFSHFIFYFTFAALDIPPPLRGCFFYYNLPLLLGENVDLHSIILSHSHIMWYPFPCSPHDGTIMVFLL